MSHWICIGRWHHFRGQTVWVKGTVFQNAQVANREMVCFQLGVGIRGGIIWAMEWWSDKDTIDIWGVKQPLHLHVGILVASGCIGVHGSRGCQWRFPRFKVDSGWLTKEGQVVYIPFQKLPDQWNGRWNQHKFCLPLYHFNNLLAATARMSFTEFYVSSDTVPHKANFCNSFSLGFFTSKSWLDPISHPQSYILEISVSLGISKLVTLGPRALASLLWRGHIADVDCHWNVRGRDWKYVRYIIPFTFIHYSYFSKTINRDDSMSGDHWEVGIHCGSSCTQQCHDHHAFLIWDETGKWGREVGRWEPGGRAMMRGGVSEQGWEVGWVSQEERCVGEQGWGLGWTSRDWWAGKRGGWASKDESWGERAGTGELGR